jgi:hypothetical protein
MKDGSLDPNVTGHLSSDYDIMDLSFRKVSIHQTTIAEQQNPVLHLQAVHGCHPVHLVFSLDPHAQDRKRLFYTLC